MKFGQAALFVFCWHPLNTKSLNKDIENQWLYVVRGNCLVILLSPYSIESLVKILGRVGDRRAVQMVLLCLRSNPHEDHTVVSDTPETILATNCTICGWKRRLNLRDEWIFAYFTRRRRL